MSSNVAPIPTSRSAWRVHSRGHPSSALKLETLPMPSPSPSKDEVLVKVHAAALNPVGYKLMSMLPNFVARRPVIAEYEFSGVVVDSNGGKNGFKEGDRVAGYTLPESFLKEGALTTHILISTAQLFHHPSTNPTHEEMSGMFITPLSAYYSLVNIAQLPPHSADHEGERKAIFINGGSTSVGRMAIMIAKNYLGYKVDVSCSKENAESMKALGADEVYDYTSSPLHKQLLKAFSPPSSKTKYSLIFDAYGSHNSSLYVNSPSYTLPNSKFISCGPQGHSISEWLSAIGLVARGFLHPAWLGGVPRKFAILRIEAPREIFEEIMRLIGNGKLIPQVDSVFAFEDTLKAYERIMTNKAKGKVVVRVVAPDA